jgi:hypothetical protein
MLTGQEIEDVTMGVLVRELHKAGVSFQTINKALAGASVELSSDPSYAPALSMVTNGIALIGIVADAGAELKS